MLFPNIKAKIQVACFFLFLMAAVAGCKNKYTYIVGIETEKSVRAKSDSAAYMVAFRRYILLKKFYGDLVEAGDSSAIKYIPDHFILFNKDGTDITQTVRFLNKDAIEKAYIEVISRTPNKWKKTNTITRSKQPGE